LAATEKIRKYLHAGQLIVLESTTYPGSTDELILPELESSGLRVGKDFFLAFSPERIDPGNTSFNTRNTPKIVGNITEECTEIARIFYSPPMASIGILAVGVVCVRILGPMYF
jgi:UDP-N-acetyl-D-glucosamine dehydrogenase